MLEVMYTCAMYMHVYLCMKHKQRLKRKWVKKCRRCVAVLLQRLQVPVVDHGPIMLGRV